MLSYNARQLFCRPLGFHPPIRWSIDTTESPIWPEGPISLYIHIPFCLTRCSFCCSITVTDKDVTDSLVRQYLLALRTELKDLASIIGLTTSIKAIHIGGGTPSLLDARDLSELIELVLTDFNCSELEEITVEASPISLTPEKVNVLSCYSNLRLNLGIQSFNDEQLAYVCRDHSGQEALNALEIAAAGRFKSVGVDLIIGLPQSTNESVLNDLKVLFDFPVSHISLYPLQLYSNTLLFHQVIANILHLPEPRSQRASLQASRRLLNKNYFKQYTAFHYGTEHDQHFYSKWQMEDRNWLGAGVGAISKISGQIWRNTCDIDCYIDSIDSGENIFDACVTLDHRERMVFTFLFGLRLAKLPFCRFEESYGRKIEDVFCFTLCKLLDSRYIQRNPDDSWSLTIDGILNLSVIESDTLEMFHSQHIISDSKEASHEQKISIR